MTVLVDVSTEMDTTTGTMIGLHLVSDQVAKYYYK